MKKLAAGLLVYRMKNDQLEVFMAHPGGPFFAKKDAGVWSIPKGLYEEGETALDAAKREFAEEIGLPPPAGDHIELGEVKRKDGKIIKIWAVEGDIDETRVKSNTFEMEWPPKSGRQQEFVEVDRAAWFNLTDAAEKLQLAQVEFLERLTEKLGVKMVARTKATEPAQASLF